MQDGLKYDVYMRIHHILNHFVCLFLTKNEFCYVNTKHRKIIFEYYHRNTSKNFRLH